ncbi:MAG TPA: sensor histidine kinase [Gemmatimonadaceae bacterium]|nr:sensor histidine kinase [Gemmatimonadaceae bacterium]
MTSEQRSVIRPIRFAALLVGAWVAFFVLQGLVSVALSPRRPASRAGLLELEVVMGVLWAVLSIVISVWHRRLRASTASLFGLIAAHAPLLVIAALLDCAVARVALTTFSHPTQLISFSAMLALYADLDVASYAIIVAAAELLLVRRALVERQRQAARLEASLNRARLDYLEAQLQPHFLFNSLGAVSELAYDAPVTADRVIRQLASIFRTALGKRTDEITLGEEIVGIEPYLDIQRIRFADWLAIDYRVDGPAVDCLVPRFVLQPLIENAIRHGLSGRRGAGTIEIAARVDHDSLVVRVADNGVGLDASRASTGRGIGLANVRDRLRILYGDDDRLRLSAGQAGGTIAELTIPARRREPGTTHDRVEEDNGNVAAGGEMLRAVRVPNWLRHPAVAIGLGWLICGMLWTQQSFIYLVLRDRLGASSWSSIAGVNLLSALIWALLTPAVLLIAKRFPLHRDHVGVRALAYLGLAAGVTLAHIFTWQRLTAPQLPILSSAFTTTFAVDFVLFFLLVAVGHRGVLIEWLRTREAAADALHTELADAQQRAAALQSVPPILLRSLDGIAETVRQDPALTERQLTRLADYLRVALECSDDRGITPERVLALDAAVVALRQTGAFSLDLTLSA